MTLIQAVQSTAILSLILWTKVVATNLGLGGAKNNAGTRAPEDSYQKSKDEVSEEAKIANDRAQRIVNNDLENIPYTMALAWGALYCISLIATDGNPDQQNRQAAAHVVMYSIFVVMRIAHSAAYALGISTLRSLVWLAAFLCSFGIAINGAIAAFQIDA